MKAKHKSFGYCWYIRAKNAEVHDFLLWHFELTKNLEEESHRIIGGQKLSVIRLSSLGLLYKIKEGAKSRLRIYYHCSFSQAVEVYVRRSPKGPLWPWPKSSCPKK